MLLKCPFPLDIDIYQGELWGIVSITNGEYVIIVAITNNRDGRLGSPFWQIS